MLTMPPAVVAAKNKLHQSAGFCELIEVQMSEAGETLRIANRNADIDWGGYTWRKSYFDNGDQTDDGGASSDTVTVRVSNINREVQGELEDSDQALIGDTVVYRNVWTGDLSQGAALTVQFSIIDAVAGEQWVTFELGAENFFLFQFPAHVTSRDVCRYRPTLTAVCQYVNSDACDRSFANCIYLGQESVFGGQPGIPGGAFNLPAVEVSHDIMDTDGEAILDTDGVAIEDTEV